MLAGSMPVALILLYEVTTHKQWGKKMKSKAKKDERDAQSDKSSEVVRVHKILGQLEGVEKMIAGQRPVLQIVQQITAAIAGLTSLKLELLKRHFNDCLAESAQTKNYSRLVQQVLEMMNIQMRK